MTHEELLAEINLLPPSVQRQVADYVMFLRAKYQPTNADDAKPQKDLADEEFVGMWADREDMKDSVQWVRDVRQREWERRK